MTEDQTFFVEDICGLRDDPTVIGVVDRTLLDVDTHIEDPRADYDERIVRHPDVSRVAFKKFLRDGVPPKNTILVSWWCGLRRPELIPTSKVQLRDRCFLVGDVVKRSSEDPMSGVITRADVRCTIAPIRQTPDQWDRSNSLEVDVSTQEINALKSKSILFDVPVSELKPSEDYNEGALVLYKNWVGRIEEIEDELYVRLSDGSVVVPSSSHPDELIRPEGRDRPCVGDVVQTKKFNLRKGRWIFGRYDPEVKPIGLILHTKTKGLLVRWLCRRLDDISGEAIAPEPPEELDEDDLSDPGFRIYDRSRIPSQDGTGESNMLADVIVADKVRFRDLSAAAERYSGNVDLSTPYGTHITNSLPLIPRTATSGYDVNVFAVCDTFTIVEVLWQDLTRSTHKSTDLLPDAKIEDDNEVWPGEIVITNEDQQVNSVDGIIRPAKVGVVQTVNAADRVAKVRWLPGASLLYHDNKELDDFMGRTLLPGSVTGSRSDNDPVEEVTLYDIRTASGLNRRRGDFVMVHDLEVQEATKAKAGVNWFGEVVDLGLDGMLTVRLGALDKIMDVQIAPEFTTLAYSSDMYDDDDDDMLDDDSEDMMEDGFDYSDLEAEDGDEDEEPQYTERFFIYKDQEGRERVVEAGSDDDEDADGWSTDEDEEEDDDDDEIVGRTKEVDDVMDVVKSDAHQPDVEMDDAKTDAVPKDDDAASITTANGPADSKEQRQPSTKDAPKNSTTSPMFSNTSSGMPLQFAVLDTQPPTNHPFDLTSSSSTSNTHRMRRIQKEHKILLTSLPQGVFVRTWESQLDLFRVLLVGPISTPYEYAPFLIDFHLPQDYPNSPPNAFFHSWTDGKGPINPNLYENGKICLSLLGTWAGSEKSESWSSSKSTLLQVIVSILGLVLVREPYFNEAGYEVKSGAAETMLPSLVYSERVYFRTRAFIGFAVKNLPVGMDDVLDWLYLDSPSSFSSFSSKDADNTDEFDDKSADGSRPRLLQKAIKAAESLISRTSRQSSGQKDAIATSEDSSSAIDTLSRGAIIMLEREVAALRTLLRSISSTPAKI